MSSLVSRCDDGGSSSSEINFERASWLDVTMITFASPSDEKMANAPLTLNTNIVWDERLLPWDNLHAYLINKEKRKRKTVADGIEKEKALNIEKDIEKAKERARKKDFTHEQGWDTRDACRVSELWDGLFLGNMNSAGSEVFIESNNIGAILNVTPNIAQYFHSIKNRRIDIADSADAPWECRLMEAMDFLDRCYASNTNVLVHCRMGQSRSVSYVLAWGMLRFKYPLRKLEDSLNIKRYGGIKVNVGFRTRLGMIAEKLGMVNMNSRSCITAKRKRYSEEFAFASYRRPADWKGRTYNASRPPRVTRSRPGFLSLKLVFQKLQAKNFIGILYREKTYGKMNSDGFMLLENDKVVPPLHWEVRVANSGAKNFNKYSAIVDIDGKKLKEPLNVREYRVANAAYVDTIAAETNASKNNDSTTNVKTTDVKPTATATIAPNTVQDNSNSYTAPVSTFGRENVVVAAPKQGPVTIV